MTAGGRPATGDEDTERPACPVPDPGRAVRDMPARWEVVDSVRRFQGRVVGVRADRVRMPGGAGMEEAGRDIVEHPGSVGVLALDDADRVLLIRQYRHPVGYLLWEGPAGLRDAPGEATRATAERELVEEAGYRAKRWHTLVDFFTSPGMTDERIRIFLARELSAVGEDELGRLVDANGDPFERVHEEADMPIAWVPLDEAVELVMKGDIHNPVAAMGILAAYAARASGYRSLREPDAPEA